MACIISIDFSAPPHVRASVLKTGQRSTSASTRQTAAGLAAIEMVLEKLRICD
jgi:hypothetical protein